MPWSWLKRSPKWLRGLLAAVATFLLFVPLFDTWSWTGPALIGMLVGLSQGYNLSGRFQAHVQRFEWDKARVAVRTVYFSLLLGLVLALSSLDQILVGEFSWGLLLAVALGGGFVWGFMATITESPRHCSQESP